MTVQLHRNTTKLRRTCLAWGLFGALVWLAARWAGADPDHFHHGKAPFYEVVSVVMVAVSLLAWLLLLWSFLMKIDVDGLTLRLRGITTRLPWESVESLTVTKVGDSWEAPNLEIRLAPGVKLGGRLASKRAGRRIYSLLALDNFDAAPEEVIAVLQRYGGGRVDAQEYLQHRAAKRAVARYMRGDAVQADPHLVEYMAAQRSIEAEKREIPSSGDDQDPDSTRNDHGSRD
ncbi:hypothetical protein ABT214_32490 [Micromonospora purpureochromogenes]|uniref:hypothetical protein n=1 Tax=Micromonospora purpureochromogenes TaxID=47872 RepID=UPI00331E78B2